MHQRSINMIIVTSRFVILRACQCFSFLTLDVTYTQNIRQSTPTTANMDKRNAKEQVFCISYKKTGQDNGAGNTTLSSAKVSTTSSVKNFKRRSKVAPVDESKNIKKTTCASAADVVVEAAEATAEELHVPEAQGSKHRRIFVLLSNLTLVGVLFGYAFMGGAIFQFLEKEHNMNSYHLFEEAREDLK